LVGWLNRQVFNQFTIYDLIFCSMLILPKVKRATCTTSDDPYSRKGL
jgi:hypothetical protein